MPERGSGRVARLFAALVVLAALVAGCAGSGFHYVKQSDDHTYFKVPDSWRLYDEDEMLAAEKGLSTEEREQARDTTWQTGFDGSPKPSIRHVRAVDTRYPTGQAIVAPLSSEQSDQISLRSLRNLFFDIDGTTSGTPATVIDYQPVSFDGGFRGSRLVAKLTKGKTSVTVNQIAVVDQDTHKVYALIVTCTTECYNANESKIEAIVNSWTVKDG